MSIQAVEAPQVVDWGHRDRQGLIHGPELPVSEASGSQQTNVRNLLQEHYTRH